MLRTAALELDFPCYSVIEEEREEEMRRLC